MKVVGILCILLLATLAVASSIKVWSGGEILRSSDLNSNFAHIHNNMVGGHGPRLVDADVSASAAIAHSKMATPALVPKAYAMVTNTPCATPATCTIQPSSGAGISQIVGLAGTGTYRIDWSPARADAVYTVMLTCEGPTFCVCTVEQATLGTASAFVDCFDAAGAAVDASFNVVMLDNL